MWTKASCRLCNISKECSLFVKISGESKVQCKTFVISISRELRTRGNWWNLNVSQTLYSKRMGKEIAKLNREEKRRIRANKEIAMADSQCRKSQEVEEKMDGELQTFVKTCGGLWG